MPRIPVYESQVQPSATTKALYQEPDTQMAQATRTVSGAMRVEANAGMMEGQALGSLGDTMGKIGNELLIERSTIEAGEAVGRLHDEERAYRTQESQNQGSNAFGAVDRGKVFYEDAVARHGEKLRGPAKQMYDQTAQRMRTSGLDSLATHELQQQDVAKKNIISGNAERLNERIKSGASEQPEFSESVLGYLIPLTLVGI